MILREMDGKIYEASINNFKMVPECFQKFKKLFEGCFGKKHKR